MARVLLGESPIVSTAFNTGTPCGRRACIVFCVHTPQPQGLFATHHLAALNDQSVTHPGVII